MKTWKTIRTFGAAMILLLGACSTPATEEGSGTLAADHKTITLTSGQISNGEIEFGVIKKTLLSHDINAKGKLVLPPQSTAFVSTPVGGLANRILVREGDHVRTGTPLLEVSSPEIIRLQQDFISSGAKLTMLEQDLKRQQGLALDGITPGKKLEEVKTEYESARSQLAALKLQLELLNIPTEKLAPENLRSSSSIVAPMSGFVERCMIRTGQFAEPNIPLMALVNNEKLYIELMVFEKDVPFVSPGQRVTFELANLGGEEFEARVFSIGKTVEEGARTVRVLAEFSNPSPTILPGMFVAAEIHTSEQEVDALPEEAVITDETESFGYYTTGNNGSATYSFVKFPVKTGFREDGFIQVEPLISLPPDARIVTKGTWFIKSAGLKQAE